MRPPTLWEQLGLQSIRADSFQRGYEPKKAVDGSPQTLWYTQWGNQTPGFPHWIQFEFQKPVELKGFRILFRQDGNRNGWIKTCGITASQNGRTWVAVVRRFTLQPAKEWQTISFSFPVKARFWRIVAIDSYSDGPWASLAEVEPIPTISPKKHTKSRTAKMGGTAHSGSVK